MFVLLRIYISILIINFFYLNTKKEERYKGWYRPWLLLLLLVIGFVYYQRIINKIADYLEIVGVSEYYLELIYCSVIAGAWFSIKTLIRTFNVDDLLYKFLQKHNINRALKITQGYDNYLLWPYSINKGKIKSRPGFLFFKIMLWISVVILLLSALWSTLKYGKTDLIIPTALSFSSILFFEEWIIYFSYKPKEESKEDSNTETEEDDDSSMKKLFRRYADESRGFYESLIFGYTDINAYDSSERLKEQERYLQTYTQRVANNESDLIISSPDFSTVIPQIADVLFNTLKKGGNILILVDIPNYLSNFPEQLKDEGNATLTEIFAKYIQEVLENDLPPAKHLVDIGVYSVSKSKELGKRIILTSMEDASSRELIHSDWIKELDLLIAFQFEDVYVNNLGQKRRISLWLEQQEKKFRTVFITNYRAGGDEAISNVWVSSKDVPEARIQNPQYASYTYFINFAYEHSIDNLDKILVGNPNEFGIAPGIEHAVFPIMEGIDHVHYFEGYDLDFIQSKNKLENLQNSFIRDESNPNSDYDYRHIVTQSKITKAVSINNLPFIIRPVDDKTCGKNHVSIVYDIENNAPKLFNKYKHLGSEESFICIISKPHLMREYFAEKLSYFKSSTIESLALQLSGSEINLCLQLLNLMINEKIDVNFVKTQLNAYSINLENKSVVAFVSELFDKYLHLDISKNAILKAEREYIFKDGKYEEIHTLKMDSQKIDNEIFEYLRDVKIIDYNRNVIMKLPKYLLFQNFLPQQNIIIDGISYDYVQYDDKMGELTLKTKPTDNFSFNKPKAEITILNNEITSIGTTIKKGVFVRGEEYVFLTDLREAEMETYYSGYYKFDRFYHSPFSETHTPRYIDLNSYNHLIETSKRKYNTRFLYVYWEIPTQYGRYLEKLTTRIHHLLYEFLPILLPYRFQYLQIASNNNFDEEHRKKTPWVFPNNNFDYKENNCIEFYLIEDSFSDLGLLDPLQNYFSKILKDLYEFIEWLKTPSDEFAYSDYLEQVKGRKFYEDKMKFLKYGIENEGLDWDLELLSEFLRDSKLI